MRIKLVDNGNNCALTWPAGPCQGHPILKAKQMRSETIALHGGYSPDSQTNSVAVPIYQTVAYAFDSADHGAALFNLETDGFRYSRIANPTTAVLEKRVADLEGGVESLCVAT